MDWMVLLVKTGYREKVWEIEEFQDPLETPYEQLQCDVHHHAAYNKILSGRINVYSYIPA